MELFVRKAKRCLRVVSPADFRSQGTRTCRCDVLLTTSPSSQEHKTLASYHVFGYSRQNPDSIELRETDGRIVHSKQTRILEGIERHYEYTYNEN